MNELNYTDMSCKNEDKGQQIFLSLKSRKAYVKVFEKIFSGRQGILLLRNDGHLFAVNLAKNEDFLQNIDFSSRMVLVATDVQHAAMSQNTIIYVTTSGEVQVIPYNTGVTNSFVRRFSGFSGAVQVFAMKNKDRYWIQDTQGEVYSFGDNHNRSLMPLSKKELYCVDKSYYSMDVAYETVYQNYQKNATEKWKKWIEHSIYENRELIRKEICYSEKYRSACEEYGAENISEWIEELSEKAIENRNDIQDMLKVPSRAYIKKETKNHNIRLTVNVINNEIYTPIKMDKSEYSFLKFSGSEPMKDCGVEKIPLVQKICFFWHLFLFDLYYSTNDCMVLLENGTLERWNISRKNSYDYRKEEIIAKNVKDVTTWRNVAIYITVDGKFGTYLMGEGQTNAGVNMSMRL